MTAYYNEFDPYCAQWLRNLIDAGHIPFGDVDERSITEIDPNEIKDYDQWHFFAGLGGWGYAARLAGIGEATRILTGSPPCQPFSNAGKQRGYADERHLAPVWLELVSALRPAWVFGEQVAAAIKKDGWLDDLLNALEAEGYATGAAVLPACGVGAPHIRQRLWVVARLGDSGSEGSQRYGRSGIQPMEEGRQGEERHGAEASVSRGLADAHSQRHHRERLLLREAQIGRLPLKVLEGARSGEFIGLADTADDGYATAENRRGASEEQGERWVQQFAGACDGAAKKFSTHAPAAGWNDPDWLYCRDGKWRPVESGTFPLADGISARVGRLRAYGNAIVPQVAAEIIKESIRIDY